MHCAPRVLGLNKDIKAFYQMAHFCKQSTVVLFQRAEMCSPVVFTTANARLSGRTLHFASSNRPQDCKVTNHMELNIIFGIRHSTAFICFLFQRRRRFCLKGFGYLWILCCFNYFKLFECYFRFFEKKIKMIWKNVQWFSGLVAL